MTDTFGIDAAVSIKDGQDAEDNGDGRRDAAESNCFKLLNELSDLLMLPKDMLLEKSIRKEVRVHAYIVRFTVTIYLPWLCNSTSYCLLGLPFYWPATSNENPQLHSS